MTLTAEQEEEQNERRTLHLSASFVEARGTGCSPKQEQLSTDAEPRGHCGLESLHSVPCASSAAPWSSLQRRLQSA